MAVKVSSDLKSSAKWLLLRRHAGIYILHVGMFVMFAGEFVTGFYAQEGRLAVRVGEWTDFVEDAISTELAFVDRTDPQQDRHVVIPQSMLERYARSGNDELISHPDLPFDIRVERYMRNCDLAPQPQPELFEGFGRTSMAVAKSPVPGTETERGDIPAVYVSLFDKESGNKLGTWLCLAWPEMVKMRADAGTIPGGVPRRSSPARTTWSSATPGGTWTTRCTWTRSTTTSTTARRSRTTSPATCASSTPPARKTARATSG